MRYDDGRMNLSWQSGRSRQSRHRNSYSVTQHEQVEQPDSVVILRSYSNRNTCRYQHYVPWCVFSIRINFSPLFNGCSNLIILLYEIHDISLNGALETEADRNKL